MATGEDDIEFDFRVFRWHRYENRSRVKRTSRNIPWAAEALLDLGTGVGSNGQSRANSPQPNDGVDMFDAGAVVFGMEPKIATPETSSSTGIAPHDFTTTIGASLGGNGLVGGTSTENNTMRPLMALPARMTTLAPTHQFTTLPEASEMNSTASSQLEQRRWADLDYQWDRQGTDPYVIPNAGGEGYTSSTLPTVGDDFSRFLEQAGYAVTDETDPFTWTSRAD